MPENPDRQYYFSLQVLTPKFIKLQWTKRKKKKIPKQVLKNINIQRAKTVTKVITILLGKGPWVRQFLHYSGTKENEAESYANEI